MPLLSINYEVALVIRTFLFICFSSSIRFSIRSSYPFLSTRLMALERFFWSKESEENFLRRTWHLVRSSVRMPPKMPSENTSMARLLQNTRPSCCPRIALKSFLVHFTNLWGWHSSRLSQLISSTERFRKFWSSDFGVQTMESRLWSFYTVCNTEPCRILQDSKGELCWSEN